jgi:hypothetical protein
LENFLTQPGTGDYHLLIALYSAHNGWRPWDSETAPTKLANAELLLCAQ